MGHTYKFDICPFFLLTKLDIKSVFSMLKHDRKLRQNKDINAH